MSEEVSVVESTPEVEVNESVENESVNEESVEVSESPADLSSDQVEAAEDVAEALENGEISEEEAIQMIKEITIKVDGKEIVRELPFEVDPNNEAMLEYLRKEAQLSTVSQKRMQEAAEARKAERKLNNEMEQFLSTLKDPNALESILTELGHDTSQFAEDLLNKQIEEMQLTPEQRELQQLREEMAKIKKAEEAAVEAKRQAEIKAMEDKYAADFQRDIMEAMDNGNLSKDAYTIQKMANLMRVAIDNNIDVSFSDIVPIIKEEQTSNIRNVLSGMSAEDILGFLSDKTVNDIVLKKSPKKKKEVPPTADSIKEGAAKKKDDGLGKAGFKTGSLDSWMRSKRLK